MASNLVTSSNGVAAGVSATTRITNANGGAGARLTAATAHLLISVAMAAGVLAVVYFGWYPEPLDSLSGVGGILLMLLSIDVILGPMLTLVIFDRRKKSLPFDLACIGVVQLAALAYGLHTVEAGRPHFLVFVKDRFEVVSKADLQPQDREVAAGNRAAESYIFGPRIVAAEMPTPGEERNNILFEAVGGGRDVQHFPKLYRDYSSQGSLAAGKARPLAELRALNPDDKGLLRDTIERSGLTESRLGFLPVKGPEGDAAMLVNVVSGSIVGMVNLQPWR